jgi:hypothetical protein
VLVDFLLEYPAISMEVSADRAKADIVQGRFDAIHSSSSFSGRQRMPKHRTDDERDPDSRWD